MDSYSLSHALILSQNHCCCWTSRCSWPPHHLHSPYCALATPSRGHYHGEVVEALPWQHLQTAMGTVGPVHLWREKEEELIYIHVNHHQHKAQTGGKTTRRECKWSIRNNVSLCQEKSMHIQLIVYKMSTVHS